MVLLFYTTYISVDLAHREIFRAKVGKGGIKWFNIIAFLPQRCYHKFITRLAFKKKLRTIAWRFTVIKELL